MTLRDIDCIVHHRRYLEGIAFKNACDAIRMKQQAEGKGGERVFRLANTLNKTGQKCMQLPVLEEKQGKE